MRATLLTFLALAAGLAQGMARADDGVCGITDCVVELHDAVWHAGKPDQKRTLRLFVERDAGGWWRPMVTGDSRTLNRGDHYGKLLASEAKGDSLGLHVRMRIEPDPWTGGEGLGVYRIVLGATNGVWRGSWEGEFRGEACRGSAGATLRPARPPAGWTPPAPGEHPRLLVRKSDLPALREKAKTDWGRQMLARLAADNPSRSSMAAGRALLYALTGDAAHAQSARELIQADIDAGKWFEIGQVHDPAAKATEALIAYDLIHETCDAAFHAQMRELLREQAPWFYRGADCPLYNLNDGSNWSAMYNSGAGMVALYLAGEPPEPYAKPREPELASLAAPADLIVGRDVPVVKLESGTLWSTWLWAGPFHAGKGLDALAALGGAARARPEHGTKVAWRACSAYATAPDPNGAPEDREFLPLDPKFLVPKAHAERYGRIAAEGAVDFAAATRYAGLTTSYVYAILENDAPGFYRVDIGNWKLLDAAVWIAGRRFEKGDVLRLDRGRYPVLGAARMAHVNGWTKIGYHVRLHAVTAEQAQSWLQTRQAYWKADTADWATDPYAERWLGVARIKVANWVAGALGDLGWNTEGEAYSRHSFRLVMPFAHCYRNTTGKELAHESGLRMALPMYVARTLFGAEGARMTGFGPGGGPPGVDTYARGFSLVPAEYRRCALWGWNRTQALADAGKLAAPEKLVDALDPLSAAFRFVNYPLDVTEEHPSKALANVTVEPRKGGYVFRNRWQDGDDCVTTVFLDSNFVGGSWASLEAADLRIQGLGADWTVRGMGWGHGASNRDKGLPGTRLAQTVVLPGQPVEGGREAAVTFFEPKPDGSGVISMNLDDLYTGRQPGAKGEIKATPVRPGAQTGYDLGIRGMRSVAVDYSGACGAPALIAVADRITGATGTNTWQFVTLKEHKVVVDDHGFTVTATNGATLRATVVAPAAPRIRVVPRTFKHETNYHGGHGGMTYTRTVVEIPGGEFFFVAMTIQRAAPPAVRVEGAGADAAVVIGGRTVRFDDAKLVLASGAKE